MPPMPVIPGSLDSLLSLLRPSFTAPTFDTFRCYDSRRQQTAVAATNIAWELLHFAAIARRRENTVRAGG